MTTSTRVTVFTTAPAAYDYGYTSDLGPAERELYPGRTVTGRTVVIPAESVTYQTDRYASGMYLVVIGA